MSLRVLLADESDSIKKVFQLSLQDYKPEIKSVQSGLDVADVAQSFKPDIIFADVLLQKKNGYDVSHEIKQLSTLQSIPVVLMWSSFMELDQAQFKKSLADDQLEKPFDADYLREMIQRLVPELAANNPIASFLNFPKTKKSLTESPVQEENSEFNRTVIATPANTKPHTEDSRDSLLNNLNFGSTVVGNSGSVSNPLSSSTKTSVTPTTNDEQWQSKDLSKFKITKDVDNDSLEKFEALNLNHSSSQSPQSEEKPRSAPSMDSISLPSLDSDLATSNSPFNESSFMTSTPLRKESQNTVSKTSGATLTESITSEMEALVRAHTQEFLKTQIQPAFNQLIEKVVREEINKLLEEEVRLNKEVNR